MSEYEDRQGLLLNLTSDSPSDRAKAASWLVQHPHEISVTELIRALQSESVPQVRRNLLRVLETRQKQSSTNQDRPDRPLTEPRANETRQQNDVDLAALIRHELSPAVGWIRLAADEEIASFADSKTNEAVKKLQRRIDGLVALVKSNEDLNLRRVHISGLLFDNWPDTLTAPTIDPAEGCKDIEIETDEGLFGLLLSNVFQNAIDASFAVAESPQVQIMWGHTEGDYWIRVTNPFAGSTFHLDDVLPVGSSSKRSHQGQGLALVADIATTLGLAISLEGIGGIASFSITGERPND